MGANAQTSVPEFTSGQVLTAQQQTEINTGIPVFADSTARDAAFGGTGEKTLAEGQFAFLEDTDTTQYYDGSTWEAVGVAPGLVLISTTTIGTTVSSVAVTGAFSSTYDNYKIVVSGGAGSAFASLLLQLGATTTGYYEALVGTIYATGVVTNSGRDNQTNWVVGNFNTNGILGNFDLVGPNLAVNTFVGGTKAENVTTGNAQSFAGYLNNTTQYTDFTIIAPGVNTLTGGTIKVYGYANS